MKGPWNIPQIWKWVEIKSLGDIVAGGTPSTKEMSYWGDDINWISPADLTGYTKKAIARGAKSLTHQGLAKSSAKLMPAGSIHFSSRAPIGYVAISSQPLSTNQGFKSLVPAQGVFNEYVYYYLKAAKYIAEERASGTTFREISGTAFGKLPLPFPPLPEQHRIVAKIEELFSELENGIENLKKAREQLKTYRQAVLKYAFEGKLTKEWRSLQRRAGNPPQPAEKLLEQIKTEREKHYKKQLEDWKKACEQAKTEGKKKPVKPKKPKELPPLTEKELADLPMLPEGWGWVKIDQLLDFDPFSLKAGPFGSALKKSSYVRNGYKIYGQEQVIKNDCKYGDYYISEEKYQELITCHVKPKDILVSLVGTIGKILILPEQIEPGIINPRLIKISLHPKSMLPEFFKFYFESAFLKSLYAIKTHGATMNILNLGIIKDLSFPFCSISEQQAIVQEIESRLSVCDKIEQTIEDSLKKAEALRQSILKKAFGGELTKDWREKHPELIAGANSAEKLLEKIKAEKALSASREKPQSKKTKKK